MVSDLNFKVVKGVNNMVIGRLEVSLSLADKRASKSQLGSPIISMLRNLKILLGQTANAAGI